MVLAHLLDSADPVNMDDLAKKYLGYKTITFKEVTGDKKRFQSVKFLLKEFVSMQEKTLK